LRTLVMWQLEGLRPAAFRPRSGTSSRSTMLARSSLHERPPAFGAATTRSPR
jgi:hypothetical protein